MRAAYPYVAPAQALGVVKLPDLCAEAVCVVADNMATAALFLARGRLEGSQPPAPGCARSLGGYTDILLGWTSWNRSFIHSFARPIIGVP